MGGDNNRCTLWILGIAPESGRGDILKSYLETGGYNCCIKSEEEVAEGKPLGILLDISPFSKDGWGTLIALKENHLTRNIPILPIFLSEKGKVGGVFPVAGFFTYPLDVDHIMERLTALGLTDDTESYDLQAMIVTRTGEHSLEKTLSIIGFDPVNCYTGKEALAVAAIHPVYIIFSSLMLPDISAFELKKKLKNLPYCSNTPLFVLLKGEMKDGEKRAISREIANFVSKQQLSCEDVLKYLRRR